MCYNIQLIWNLARGTRSTHRISLYGIIFDNKFLLMSPWIKKYHWKTFFYHRKKGRKDLKPGCWLTSVNIFCENYIFVQNRITKKISEKSVQKRFFLTICVIWYHLYNLKNVKNTVRDVLKIKNLTNRRTWLFFNKYVLEHTFSVSWVCEATVRN